MFVKHNGWRGRAKGKRSVKGALFQRFRVMILFGLVVDATGTCYFSLCRTTAIL